MVCRGLLLISLRAPTDDFLGQHRLCCNFCMTFVCVCVLINVFVLIDYIMLGLSVSLEVLLVVELSPLVTALSAKFSLLGSARVF